MASECAGGVGTAFLHWLQSGSVPTACLLLDDQRAKAWGAAVVGCIPPEAMVLHTLRAQHPFLGASRS